LLRLEPAAGGRSKISVDDYVEGPPELIVEAAASSASHDLRDKLRVYCRNGVQEYVVWLVYEQRVDWFRLDAERGKYVPLLPEAEGLIHSQVFPGLNLAVEALLDGDVAQVLATLQASLETEEHTALVARLTAKSGPA
jgi:Uma2 family endonuclease